MWRMWRSQAHMKKIMKSDSNMGKKSVRDKAKKIEEEPEEQINVSDFASTDDEFSGFESTDSEGEQEQEETPKTTAKPSTEKEEPANKSGKNGVVYVGRIPHGFYETEMRKYFSQFGNIKNIRISRNKRSGKSKHYGFIEFDSPEVADIVADTMDGYIIWNHILKVKRVPPENIHKDLWVGANKKFNVINWRDIGRLQHEQKHSREWWEEHHKQHLARKLARSRKLKKMGIDYKY